MYKTIMIIQSRYISGYTNRKQFSIRTVVNFQKKKFEDQTLFYFGKMVDNGTAMLDHFVKTNELL